MIRIGYKDIGFGFYPFTAYALSNNAVLVFNLHSAFMYKLSNLDLNTDTYQVAKVIEFKLSQLIENNEAKCEMAIIDNYLINACKDNTLKKINLINENNLNQFVSMYLSGKKLVGHMAGSIKDSLNHNCYIIAKVDRKK